MAQGAYVLADTDGTPDVILLATGSEVALAMAGRAELAGEGINARVVSMPCWELFDRQPQDYQDTVLPPAVKARVGIEQASTLGWDRYVGDGGAVIGMHTFGASAPLKQLLTKFGFTPERVAEVAARPRRGWKGIEVKATELLNELGQSLWLDNITRKMLDDGVIQRYVDEYSVTGLTSNPSIFDKAIGGGRLRRRDPREVGAGASRARALFFELAIEDLRRAADTVPRRPRAHRRGRRLGVARGVARARVRHRRHRRRGHRAARPGRPAATCSSRSPARPRACPRSSAVDRRPASRSTSRCCSTPTSTAPRPTRT